MKAAVFRGKNTPLSIEEFPKPVPAKNQVLVKLRAASLNHRDILVQDGPGPFPATGIVLGSDGSGVVEDVGEEVEESFIGQEVVINPSVGWGKNPTVQADSYKILGFPDHGTFAEYVVVHYKNISDKPEHLSHDLAAAVPLAGLTAYRALFSKARIRPGEKVLITGIGGGAALWALKMATAFQCIVYVTSGSEDKLKKGIALGAKTGFNYKDSDWTEKAKKEAGGFDVIIDSAGGEQFPKLLELAFPGARIVLFGRTAGDIAPIPPRLIYWKQLSLFGTTMGNEDEFLSMLDFVHKHKIIPVIDQTLSLAEANQAFARMKAGSHFGKIVLKIS
ncbi:MAG TPA: zinc-binding dehydrogenase [Cyclobacteriaceae bacterium]|nr:zinc-binding dehydrogenase [Cyclobacteriaceae bacterium]